MYGAEISSSSSTIAKCWEAFCGLSVGSALSTPRWAISAVMSLNAVRPLSVKLKVTTGWRVSSKFCSGFLMSVPESAGLSWMTQKRSGSGASALGFWSRTTRMPSGTSMTSALARSSSSRSCERGLARLRRLAVVERLLGLLVERVEARRVGGAVVAVALRVALGGLEDRAVEARDRRPAVGVLVRVRPAVLVEDVGFPVVEEQLGGGADLLGGALGVVLARQVDLDLVLAGLEQLRLGHAEGVDAVAHDVQRPLERLAGDRGLLGGRLALVDELDAALEVQAELGVLPGDHVEGRGEQAEHDQQDE